MKKYFFSFFAIALAIFAVAFTTPKKAFTDYYWFPADQSEVIQPILASESMHSTNPFTCPTGNDVLCTKAYNAAQTETFVEGGVTKRRPIAAQLNLQQVLVKKIFQ